MRKILCIIATVAVVLAGAMSAPSAQVSKKVYEKVALTANGTLTYPTDGYTNIQLTITKDAGTPDGTISAVTKPSSSGGAVTVVTGYVPAGTKTFEGSAQNVLVVTLATHTTGTIGVEVVLW